jgi:hypothetical protein
MQFKVSIELSVHVALMASRPATKEESAMTYTVGGYLAERLVQIGLKHHFVVPGDYNLVLLDQLLLNKKMQQVGCCNELNCGFAAEGYARANGAAAAVVTFSMGALSAFNAMGGAFAENLPVIVVSGAPNTKDRASDHLLHHTLGTHDFAYQLKSPRSCPARRWPSRLRTMRLTRSTMPFVRRCAKKKAGLYRNPLQHRGSSVCRAGADQRCSQRGPE